MLTIPTFWKASLPLLLFAAVWLAIKGLVAANAEPRTYLVHQAGHGSSVTSITYSPDGRLILTGSSDRMLKAWDAATGTLLRTFKAHAGDVRTIAILPDSRRALSAGEDNLLKLWNIATGQLLRTFGGHSVAVSSIAIFPDGRRVLSAGHDNTLKLWDVETGKLLRTFVGDGPVAVSPDNRLVLSRGSGNSLKLWDTATGESLRILKGHSDRVVSAVFSPDGQQVLSGGEERTIRLWDVETGQLLRTFEIEMGQTDTYLIAFSQDGRRALLGGLGKLPDKIVAALDLVTGKLIRTFEAFPVLIPQYGHRGVNSVALSPNGSHALIGGRSGQLMLWDVATGKLLRNLGENSYSVESIAISPDGRRILSGSQDSRLKLWDATTGSLLRVFRPGSSNGIVAFSPNGRHVLSERQNSTYISLWDAATGKPVRNFQANLRLTRTFALGPDGKRLLTTTGGEGELKLWDVSTGKLVRTFDDYHPKPPWHSVASVAFSPDGSLALTGARDNTLKLWEVATGKLLRIMKGHSGYVMSVAFSPDGRHALSGSGDRTLKLWDVATGKLRRTFQGQSSIMSVAISPDGHRALSAGFGKTVNLWDLATGQVLRSYEGHSDTVSSVAFSPDGRSILSGSWDGSIIRWSLSTGRELVRMRASGKGDWLSITPSGYFHFGGAVDSTVHLVRGLEVISVQQVFQHLYRPDLIREIMNGDLEGKHKDAAHRLNLDAIFASGPPPQIEHLAENDDRAGQSIRLSVRITGTGGGVGRKVVWKVNGVTQGNSTAAVFANVEGPLASAVVTETLKLASGQKNVIEVTAYNRKGLVATRPFRITIDKFGTATSERPRMFVLAVGVNNYRMKDYRLSYAANDARSFARALDVVGTALFSDVKTHVLTDERVSEAAISDAVREISAEAKPQDVFVLFLAGHGKSIAGRYYYYPQSLDFAEGQSVEDYAIGQDKWEKWLAQIPVQKSLLVIDTCEGDAFRGSRGADSARQTAMTQLQYATGRNIIAAARDAAYEGYRGHGVLTYAILEALDKKTSVKGNKRVGIAAIADHVGVRVPEISRGNFGILQNPTRKLTGNDFPIGIREDVLDVIHGDAPTIPKKPTHVLIRSVLLRERPAADARASRELPTGMQVRAVEFHGQWAIVARDGKKLGYVPVDALVRLQ